MPATPATFRRKQGGNRPPSRPRPPTCRGKGAPCPRSCAACRSPCGAISPERFDGAPIYPATVRQAATSRGSISPPSTCGAIYPARVRRVTVRHEPDRQPRPAPISPDGQPCPVPICAQPSAPIYSATVRQFAAIYPATVTGSTGGNRSTGGKGSTSRGSISPALDLSGNRARVRLPACPATVRRCAAICAPIYPP